MKKSGCWQIGFSLENADSEILKMSKFFDFDQNFWYTYSVEKNRR